MRFTSFVLLFFISMFFFGCGAADLSSFYNFNKNSNVNEAVSNNDIESLKAAVNKGADVDAKNSKGQTALHIAAMKNNKEMAEFLIKKGADLNVKDNFGETPLFYAIRFGSSDVFSLLMSNKADMDIVNNSGESLSLLVMNSISGGDNNIARADVKKELAKNRIVVDGNPEYSDFYDKNPIRISGYVKNPMKKVEQIVNERINDFVSLKDNPVDIPPVVKKPELPKPISLKKSDFESSRSFRARVEKAQEERKKEILALQNEYRKKVEYRNKKIQEAEKIAKMRKESIPAVKKMLMYDALNAVFGGFEIRNPKYNADKELMYVDMVAKKADYKKRIALKVPEGKIAKDFYDNINNIPVKAVFSIDNNALQLADVEAKRGVLTAKADLNAGEFIKPEPVEVVVKNTVKFNEISQKQNPNLVDTANVNIVVYEKTKDSFKDDLPRLLAKSREAKPDNSKWLIAIGAEDYDNTDKVVYSARSSKMFVKVASKVLGIPKSHIYTAIGDKATAGAIKSSFKRLVSNVKPGDTVYFYYSGHGIPVLPSKEPYILPKDTVPDYIADEKFFRLQNLYKMLSDSNASKVVAFVDSCFSGATDGVSVYKGVAASRLRAKKVTFDKSKMAVITAGTGEQFSNMYPDKGHRLFSYYVMKSMLKGRKDVKTLYNEVFVEVKDTSFKLGGDNRKQEPVLQGNVNLKL